MLSSKTLLIIKTTVFLLFFSVISCWSLSSDEIKKLYDDASEMNMHLPMMISKEVQLTRVLMRSDYEITYVIKTIYHSKKQLAPPSIIKASVAKSLCSTPLSYKNINNGAIYTHVVYDKDNNYAYEYSISAKDCKLLAK